MLLRLQGMDDLQVRAAATDIFSYLVEFSPSMVREFVMQEPQQTDDVSPLRSLQSWTSPASTSPLELNLAIFSPFPGCLADQRGHQANDL